MTKNRLNLLLLIAAMLVITASPLAAQTLTTLFTFDGSDGQEPTASLVQGFDGDFYGTTDVGGLYGPFGTVFGVTPSGTQEMSYSFCSQPQCLNGSVPVAGLVQATDGNLYGATQNGGASGRGTIFKITPGGTLVTIYSFCAKERCKDGTYPLAALVQTNDGNFAGATSEGGTGGGGYCSTHQGCGTIFKITSTGILTTLYNFCAQTDCVDGFDPTAGLFQAADGNLYGTTNAGGQGHGTVFRITPSEKFTVLHSFSGGDDGAAPEAPLIQAVDGALYGTTNQGGSQGCHACGTAFKITTGGTFAAYHFVGTNGAFPVGGLVQATDGDFYGTTSAGGSGDNCGNETGRCGTIFKLTSGGKLSAIYSFCTQTGCPDGFSPVGGLVQGTDGNMYGTTSNGGNNAGTIFSVSLGLGPFVKTLTTSGKIGETVIILGTNLTGSTGVTFNGTAAAFTIASSSEITTTVPSGATSGVVSVTTPGGVLNSNQAFQVKP
jgi:uncharacterized repeat protein (TIGR03803 family)